MTARGAALVAALTFFGAPGPFGAREARAASPEQDAKETFDRWLATQNEGNFPDYARLYAQGFMGVKRSRTRTTSFDRAGWLADRRRMFQKKMTVEASNVRILAKPKTALVVFTQRWSSGGYVDVGPKHLVMRRASVGYEILREELFASNLEAKGGIDVAAFQRFAFVLDGEVVVSTEPKDEWASGPPLAGRVGKDFVLRSKRPVDLKKLPAELVALEGTAIRLFDAKGVRCDAKLGAFLLRGRVFTDPDGSEGGWEMSNHFLVAKIEGNRKACAGATWARAASLPAPAIAAAAPATPELERRGWAAFEALPESRAIQRSFDAWTREHHATKSLKWYRTSQRPPTIRMIRSPSGPVLISILATGALGESGCNGDGVDGRLWGLWELTGPRDDPTLVLRNHPDEALALDVSGAVDVDGDGQAELLFDGFQDPATISIFGQGGDIEHGLLRALGGVYVDVAAPETPVLICPC